MITVTKDFKLPLVGASG